MRAARTAVVLRAGSAVVAATLLLTGCAGDVDGELRRAVADVTDDANAGDYEAVQDSAQSLIERAQEAVSNNDISAEEGARIIELATLLRDRAAAREAAESTPSPEPTVEAPQEPTEEPEQEPEQEQTQAPASPPAPSPRPTSPPPTQAPSSPAPAPSPSEGEPSLLPEVPGG